MILKCEECKGKLIKLDSYGYATGRPELLNGRVNIPYFQCLNCNRIWHRIKRNGLGKQILSIEVSDFRNINKWMEPDWKQAAQDVAEGKVRKETPKQDFKVTRKRSRLQSVE